MDYRSVCRIRYYLYVYIICSERKKNHYLWIVNSNSSKNGLVSLAPILFNRWLIDIVLLFLEKYQFDKTIKYLTSI